MKTLGESIVHKLDRTLRDIQSDQPLSDRQRQLIEERLKRTKHEFQKFQTWVELAEEMADIGLWEHDRQEDRIFWSDETYRIWGYNPQEIVPSMDIFLNRIHPDDRERVKHGYQRSTQEEQMFNIVYRLKLPDGQIKFVESKGYHFYDIDGTHIVTVGTNQNITDREQEKQDAEEALRQNKTILDEIHHRVKNNLAIVAGMLQLEWLQEDNPKVIKTLQESANRIKTVAGIHQQLYESGHFADVSLGENIGQLTRSLLQTMQTDTEVQLDTSFDDVYTDLDQSLPCALITNEVVTNAIKHAFEGQEKGKIAIELKKADNQISLRISDNGKGLPEGYNGQGDSLGMSLINTLGDQLDAEYKFTSSEGGGTTFTMKFRQTDSEKFDRENRFDAVDM